MAKYHLLVSVRNSDDSQLGKNHSGEFLMKITKGNILFTNVLLSRVSQCSVYVGVTIVAVSLPHTLPTQHSECVRWMLAKKPLVVRAGSLGSACSRARDRWCSLAATVVLSRRAEERPVLQVSRPGLTTPLPEAHTPHTPDQA